MPTSKINQTIWEHPELPGTVQIIDQRWLPHKRVIENLSTLTQFETAIRDMHVRGAPLIGATAAYGMYVAAREAPPENRPSALSKAARILKNTRPTAVNLAHAVERVLSVAKNAGEAEILQKCLDAARAITEESISDCRKIGVHGLPLIEAISARKGGAPVQILTHCNAGWLACVRYGTATAPIYLAHEKGIPVHVWVDETRPRNQGARLTAFELSEAGVPHTVIADNTGGHLMQRGMVDLVITGSDRTTIAGDVANKIGTYLKALAARDNGVPFYVALPGSTIDPTMTDGLREIPIEERGGEEVRFIQGHDGETGLRRVLLTPENSPAANYAFDVTPARLITGLITERGICRANRGDILRLFPEYSGD
ncbi:MAG: S-methyl-5-thioribose-1-phosphate isomerase [Bacteroidetes bacterium]|nr:MAG: S-methyl-5-thioribose-1-phosphate isomerase [Bacteroidota bacterium]